MIPPDLVVRLRRTRFAGMADLVGACGLFELVDECHPTRPPRAGLYYCLHPTLMVYAEDDKTPIGYATVSLTPSVCLLYDSGVAPSARRQGLGRALLAERLRLGMLNGCQVAVGGVEATNDAMRPLLLSAGFEIHHTPGAPGPDPCTTTLDPTGATYRWIEACFDKNPWLGRA